MTTRRLPTRPGRLAALCAAAALLIAACGDAAAEQTPRATIGGIGQLPSLVATSSSPAADSVPAVVERTAEEIPTEEATTTTVAAAPTLGSLALGNRVLMIGDSILAATTRRYSNDMCEAMVPLGWRVDVEAESGRHIDFGQRVVERKWKQGWDAVMILLGNNYGGDIYDFAVRLDALLTRVGEIPVLLSTVTPFVESRDEVNAVILRAAEGRANVRVLPWDTISMDRADQLLGADGLHLTDVGRQTLAASVAEAFGEAPGQPGECLKPDFQNDSNGPPVRGSSTPSSTRVRTTTTRPMSGATSPPTIRPSTSGAPSQTSTVTTEGSQPPKTSQPTQSTQAPSTSQATPTSQPSNTTQPPPPTTRPATSPPTTEAPNTTASGQPAP